MGPLQLSTVPNAGMPAAFRKKTPNGDARLAAGIMFITPGGKMLFVKRSPGQEHAGDWAFPAGRVEEDEEPADAARREALEEVGHLAAWNLAPLLRETRENVDFSTFAQEVPSEFYPVLNEEHNEHAWRGVDELPEPLHPGVAALLKRFFAEEAEEPEHGSGTARELEREFGATDHALKLALDRASVRRIDQDGHLHIAETNVCKACISPYRGEEIQAASEEDLGLDPDKIYQMLRPPEELEKAAATINGKPLLRTHVATSADDHKKHDVAGAVGTTARWDPPYIKNGLTIWDQKDIDGVEDKTKFELSPGYHYRPVMEPGTFEGEHYDGRMVDIAFNHLAIVEQGRQGKDVTIGDAMTELAWHAIGKAIAEFAA